MSGLAVDGIPGGDSGRAAHSESSHLRHRDLETVRRRLVRLAFDIHDGPLQSLAAAGFGLKDLHARVSALLADTPERDTAGKLIVELIDELSETERALRKLVDTLENSHPEIADASDLLEAELRRFQRRSPANVVVEGEWQFRPDSHSQALALEGLLREALTNIVKPARASNVTIRLQTSSSHVLLEIEDDGCGFEPRQLGEATMGLTSMRERVKLIGGEFEILSRQGGPTLVTATLRRWRRALPAAAAYTSPPIAARV